MSYPFYQVDVFAKEAMMGNPVAVVVIEAGMPDLDDQQMQSFARWTNLSETTFLYPDTDGYLLRIFTPHGELPFAGHPTLGSCKAWIEHTGRQDRDVIVQRCKIGNVTVRVDRTKNELAFAAPELVRTGQVEASTIARACRAMSIDSASVIDSQWIVNGPEWFALRLNSAKDVLKLRFGATNEAMDLIWGVFGPHDEGTETKYEIRTFAPALDVGEDPVTGSFNAGLAVWLGERCRAEGVTPDDYIASQGTAIGRKGRVSIYYEADGTVWVGGSVNVTIRGRVSIHDERS